MRKQMMDKEIPNNEAIWKLYSPTPNHWFVSEINYEGWGIASFGKPVGTIEGKTLIHVDEIGNLDIEMEFEKLNTDAAVSGSGSWKIQKFLHGNFGPENMIAITGGNENPCISFSVQTEDGLFESEGNIFWSTGFGLDNKLSLWLSRGKFSGNSSQKPKYWVVPLTNFISTFHYHFHPLLTRHPLRLFTTPVIPDLPDEIQKQMAFLAANRRNILIAFEFGNSFGFIEPIPDYAEKGKNLESGKEKQCITAIMVGEIVDQLDQIWFPQDFVSLISLASGTVVGASWLEFRDQDGILVSRKHFPNPKVVYEKGYAVIDEAIHSGLGQLISDASKSSEFREDYYRVLIGHLVEISSHGRHFENHMTILGRTFEMLSEKLGVSRQDLKDYLPPTYEQDVNEILTEAQKKVRKLFQRAEKDGLIDAGASLRRIESKIANASNTDGDFGMKVMEVLKKYEMLDLFVEKDYSQHGRSQNRTWVQTLSQLRNTPLHKGYFPMRDGTFDPDEIVSTENHLHDLLVRIALKIIGYKGYYQPRVIDYLVNGKTVDWVNSFTTVIELGYKV
jgi:hypothetical protein